MMLILAVQLLHVHVHVFLYILYHVTNQSKV